MRSKNRLASKLLPAPLVHETDISVNEDKLRHQKEKNSRKPQHLLNLGGVAKILASAPLEYHASIYAKELQLRRQKLLEKERKNLLDLKNQFTFLKKKLKTTSEDELRSKLILEISNLEKAIKKAPKPKRKWSPVLPGSFESNKA